MRYKCLIAEDNPMERDVLEELLNQTGTVDIAGICSDGLEAYNILISTEVDIVFSDIDMPKMNGFSLVKSLVRQPVFVFTTSHPDYAAESYNLDVADFIVKPVTIERVLRALHKATALLKAKSPAADRDETVTEAASIFIRTGEMLLKIALRDMVYLESEGNSTKIFTVSGESYSTLVSSKNLALQLPHNYMLRTHRGFMVNPQHIKGIGPASILMRNNRQVPLSERYRQEVADAMQAHPIQRFI
ncbi:MAG: LytTR family DNA-binding domain-containing protein [Bacteroidota bacterium]